MKPIVLATLVVALLAGTAPALADGNGRGGYNGGNGHGGNDHGGNNGGNDHGGYDGGRGHGGYNGGHGHGGYNGGYGHHGYNYGHGGGYYNAPYRGGYYYPSYYGYSHHNNNNSNNGAAYALGGLVVGSLLTNAYFQNRVSQPVYVEQTTYQAPSRVVVVQQPQGRRLLKDLSGNCYERTTDGAGNELRTELPPSECNW